MQDKELIHINLSRIIHARKWRVIRLLTKIHEFPSYIPCVKSVELIEKSRHTMKTKWRIEINKIPINWVETDNLDLRNNSIKFQAQEGDLEEFRGEWKFQDHHQGTKVTLYVCAKVGIPTIKIQLESYIEKILSENFNAILRAIDNRLVSTRYARFKKGETQSVAGFGIVGHLYNFYHLEQYVKVLDPEVKMPSMEFLSRIFRITPSFKLFDVSEFKSATGQTVNGCFIMSTFIPEMIKKDVWGVFSKVVKSCRIAEKQGMGIVSLAGFASIVEDKIGQEIGGEVDVPVTSGNTYTVALVVEGIFQAMQFLDLDITKAKLAIVGAAGNIGSGCARMFADKVKELILTGKSKDALKDLQHRIFKKYKNSISIALDNELAVRNADIVICCANSITSFLKMEWFKPGAIVCDVGYPRNVESAVVPREDVFIFNGGLAKSPTAVTFPFDMGLPAKEVLYGCFAEAIILALEKRYENFSSRRGYIIPEKVEEIKTLGEKHGFGLADLYWCNKKIDDDAILKVKNAIA